MKAMLYDRYGGPEVFYKKELSVPIPKDNEMLIHVHASSVNAGATWIRKGKFPGSLLFTFLLRLMYGLLKPRKKIMGFEFSGIVEQTGKDVTRFTIGDAVFGTTTGLQQGAYAEYLCVPQTLKQGVVMLKPDALGFEAAAVLPIGAMTALQLLQKMKIKPGDSILIYGASGSVGSYAVQIARYYGAVVTAVCRAVHFPWVRAIGATELLDYTGDDFKNCSQRFDLIFDAVAKVKPSSLCKLLKKKGRYQSVKSLTRESNEHLQLLLQMIREKQLVPFIDRMYTLDQLTEAHQYVDQGHKKGNVVIRCI